MAARDQEHPRVIMRRVVGGFVPAAPYDEERLMHYGVGHDVEVQLFQRRSLPHLRLYWAVLHEVVENSEGKYGRAEDLHEALKVALGYQRKIQLLDGATIILPGSIALTRMDQAEFNVYFQKVEVELSGAGYDVKGYIDSAKRKMFERRQVQERLQS